MEQPVDQPFADLATQYARDVVDRRVLACKWHRLACQRHLNDLSRSALDPPGPMSSTRNWKTLPTRHTAR